MAKTIEQSHAALAHLRPKKRAITRISRSAAAKTVIEDFDHDMDIICLTMGQFSLIDLIQATLEKTGPAHVTISTWSTSFYDIGAALAFKENGLLQSIRFLMDGVQRRGQADGATVAEVFGQDCIRTIRSHAKFVIIENDNWNIVITSSMNLNLNQRCEQFEMTDDKDRADMFRKFRDSVWEDMPEGYVKNPNTPPLNNAELTTDPQLFTAGELTNIRRLTIAQEAG